MMKKTSIFLLLALSFTFGLPSAFADPLDPLPIGIAPELVEVTPVPAETYDTTPDYTFSSTLAGTIIYGGDCSSAEMSAIAGENKITFGALSYGVHDNCTIKVESVLGVQSATLEVSAFEVKNTIIINPGDLTPIDLFPPTISIVTGVDSPTLDHTPSFVISSNEAGTASYAGACESSDVNIVVGDNTITFNSLAEGSYDDCTITVTDASGNESTPLTVPTFSVVNMIIIDPSDVTPPILTLVQGVNSPTSDSSPSVIINSNENGTASYAGACSSATTDIESGDNTIILNPLTNGTYSDCQIKVTDNSGNKSEYLDIPEFKLENVVITEKCADFEDISALDPDCGAFEYVKSIGAMTGNPDGTFAPNGLLQRDQISKIALESFDKFDSSEDYCGGGNPFPDVTSSDWSYQYVCRAKGLGVVTGYQAGEDAGYFRPGRAVNRVEFLAFILRNLSEDMPVGSSYEDVNASDWFADYAMFAYVNDLFDGTSLNPAKSTTRREVAQVLFQLKEMGKI